MLKKIAHLWNTLPTTEVPVAMPRDFQIADELNVLLSDIATIGGEPCEIEPKHSRETLSEAEKMGLAKYHYGSWQDDGYYALTDAGQSALSRSSTLGQV